MNLAKSSTNFFVNKNRWIEIFSIFFFLYRFFRIDKIWRCIVLVGFRVESITLGFHSSLSALRFPFLSVLSYLHERRNTARVIEHHSDTCHSPIRLEPGRMTVLPAML